MILTPILTLGYNTINWNPNGNCFIDCNPLALNKLLNESIPFEESFVCYSRDDHFAYE